MTAPQATEAGQHQGAVVLRVVLADVLQQRVECFGIEHASELSRRA